MINNATQRVGLKFNEEIEFIKSRRLELGMDKKKKSTRVLTDILIKHSSWELIKRHLILLKIKEGVLINNG